MKPTKLIEYNNMNFEQICPLDGGTDSVLL